MATVSQMMAAKRERKCNIIKKNNEQFLKKSPKFNKNQIIKHRIHFKNSIFNSTRFFTPRARKKIIQAAKGKLIQWLETDCPIAQHWLIVWCESIVFMAKFYNMPAAIDLAESAIAALHGHASAFYCLDIIELSIKWLEIFPRIFVVYARCVIKAKLTILHSVAFQDAPEWQTVFVWHLVDGMSFRDVANFAKSNHYTQTETELREIILDRAWHLNVMLSLYEQVGSLNSLTQLRNPPYRRLRERFRAWLVGLKINVINRAEYDTGLAVF